MALKSDVKKLLAEADSKLEQALSLVSDAMDGTNSAKREDQLQCWADAIESAKDSVETAVEEMDE